MNEDIIYEFDSKLPLRIGLRWEIVDPLSYTGVQEALGKDMFVLDVEIKFTSNKMKVKQLKISCFLENQFIVDSDAVNSASLENAERLLLLSSQRGKKT
ncbi:hypothetical protein Back11_19390 [Paenibacillus baekrokdamisoli]|uniref:Uncharacterized protein n=1 Tax=Paenibacillus baekrokdamisoli TaxID=1712516 RepID=A0A3G9JBD6_9BACL|nr:hypothetical protein [Paenibacillus baekrokdamisoli]MBB3070058.1 hypothetical protein [Paenibacillus baekrokdamisoli]BBH20594.1 hypothetical protein Back11_19390 [Paenibacillus baekrokdamisoli]